MPAENEFKRDHKFVFFNHTDSKREIDVSPSNPGLSYYPCTQCDLEDDNSYYQFSFRQDCISLDINNIHAICGGEGQLTNYKLTYLQITQILFHDKV